jgi:hypothetical protein
VDEERDRGEMGSLVPKIKGICVLVIFKKRTYASGRGMIFDMSGEGLLTIFKPYQAALLEHIWELNKDERVGINSRQAYKFLQDHPDSKSRASVIIFLNEMVEEGVMEFEDRTGKGGHHRVYYPRMDREQFARPIVETRARGCSGRGSKRGISTLRRRLVLEIDKRESIKFEVGIRLWLVSDIAW